MNMVDQEGFQISKRSRTLRQYMPEIYSVDICEYDERDGCDDRKIKAKSGEPLSEVFSRTRGDLGSRLQGSPAFPDPVTTSDDGDVCDQIQFKGGCKCGQHCDMDKYKKIC